MHLNGSSFFYFSPIYGGVSHGIPRWILSPCSEWCSEKQKPLQCNYCKGLNLLARPEGIEPPTKSLEGSHSIRLSYGRLFVDLSMASRPSFAASPAICTPTGKSDRYGAFLISLFMPMPAAKAPPRLKKGCLRTTPSGSKVPAASRNLARASATSSLTVPGFPVLHSGPLASASFSFVSLTTTLPRQYMRK